MNVVVRNLERTVWKLTSSDVYFPRTGTNGFRRTLAFNKFNQPVVHIPNHKNLRPESVTINSRNISFELSDDIRHKFKRLIRQYIYFESGEDIVQGYKCYCTISQVNIEEFFNLLGLEDTFYSWVKVIHLHVWMLLVKLMQGDPTKAKTIRKGLVMAMWEDITVRAKKLCALNQNYKKNMTQFTNEFRMILFSYDEGLLGSDKILSNALWYYFFDGNCEDPQKLEALISYIRFHINQLMYTDLASNSNISGEIWKPLKSHFENLQ